MRYFILLPGDTEESVDFSTNVLGEVSFKTPEEYESVIEKESNAAIGEFDVGYIHQSVNEATDPNNDIKASDIDEYLDKLVVTVAARIAEELIFGPEKIGSGAAGDIQQVTNLARAMVTQMGYSEKLGRVRYTGNQEEVFLGHSVTQSKNISEETARIIDQEVIRLVQEAEAKARKILTENMKDLHIIAKGLLEYETLTGDEIKNLLKGIKPKRDNDMSDDADKPSDDAQKSPSNKGPLPSFTKDQNFPLPN